MRAPLILLVSGSPDGSLPFQRLLASRLPAPPILATQDLDECLRSPSPGPFDLCVVAALGEAALGAQACRLLRERQGSLGPPIVLLVEEAADLETLGIGPPEGVEVLPVHEEGGPLLGSALRSLLRARFAEEALRRGEQAAGLGSWTLNVRKDQMEWSQGMYRIFGRVSDDPVTSFSQFLELSVHPDDRAEAALRAEAADDSEELEPFVCRIVLPDGSLRRVWIQGGERVREQDGSLRFVTGIAQDITEQREAEEQLLRQNALLAAIFDSAPYAMITVDPSGRVLSTNQMGALFSELPAGQNIGVMCGDFIRCRHAPFGPGCGQNPECPDCPIRGALNRSLESGRPVQGVEATLHLVRGGQPVPLEVVISASPIPAGPDPRVLLTFADVTERRRAERALAASEERYRRIVETAHEGIITLDAGG
ncbi:MAG TPA: PAS domain S-box protein, partial [Armatimonadota bacterium]